MVECELTIYQNQLRQGRVLIDTWWNVNQF